jgi:hypothetical protein
MRYALHELEATGLSRSEAVRSALVAAADDSEIANG